ncbi:MAG: winged helix-turn-helix domain-containing protein [Thermostichus sp. HHBFW_bins_43]
METTLTLQEFIDSNPDARELKRALAVQMVQHNYRYEDIRAVLHVSLGFISKWKQRFADEGVQGLRLAYPGASPYLSAEQRAQVLAWLKQKQSWHLAELQQHLEETYDVVFASRQSYYELFHAAGIHWKKTQATNPSRDPEQVEKKNGNYRMA